jgi:hypothetical protein
MPLCHNRLALRAEGNPGAALRLIESKSASRLAARTADIKKRYLRHLRAAVARRAFGP